MNGNEEESSWDALASDLGLEPAPKPALPPPPPTPAEAKPSEPPARAFEPADRDEVVEVIPAHVTEIEMKITSVADVSDEAPPEESAVEDAADVLDDEAPETSATAAGEEPGEGDGKGRRRRRRRRRKKGGPETVAADSAAPAPVEEASEIDVLSFPTADDEEPADEVPADIVEEAGDTEEIEDEVEEIIPAVALAEEGEEESAEPLPEWKVTAWTDLVATLYRPQDR